MMPSYTWRSRTLLQASRRALLNKLRLSLHLLQRLTGSALYEQRSSWCLLSIHWHSLMLLCHLRLHLRMRNNSLLSWLSRMTLVYHLSRRATLHVHRVHLPLNMLMLHMRVHMCCLSDHCSRMRRLDGDMLLAGVRLPKYPYRLTCLNGYVWPRHRTLRHPWSGLHLRWRHVRRLSRSTSIARRWPIRAQFLISQSLIIRYHIDLP